MKRSRTALAARRCRAGGGSGGLRERATSPVELLRVEVAKTLADEFVHLRVPRKALLALDGLEISFSVSRHGVVEARRRAASGRGDLPRPVPRQRPGEASGLAFGRSGSAGRQSRTPQRAAAWPVDGYSLPVACGGRGG